MGNSFFQCKQFMVHQDRCAMKVTTDACLFGAATAAYLQKKPPENVLDIGTGTGILSLMLAQTHHAHIDAVEIEPDAASQAIENCSNSHWSSHIQVHHSSIQAFAEKTKKEYEAIICNPPFFADHLKSTVANRNLAMHQSNISLPALFTIVHSLLHPQGIFSILLPHERATEAIHIATQQKLFLAHQIHIKQTDRHNYFRVIQFFTSYPTVATETEITIKINNEYTSVFSSLLAPYYLHL